MTAVVTPQVGDEIKVPIWGFALMALGVFGAYLMLHENGWLVSNWMTIHEFFHDGRHSIGVPCH
jgi:hypothetical protein